MFGNNDRLLKLMQIMNIVLSVLIAAALVAYGIVYAVTLASPIAVIFIVGGLAIGALSWLYGMFMLYIVRDLKFMRNKLYDVENKGPLKTFEMDPYTYNAGMYLYPPPYDQVPPYAANAPYGGYGGAPVPPAYESPVRPAPAPVRPVPVRPAPTPAPAPEPAESAFAPARPVPAPAPEPVPAPAPEPAESAFAPVRPAPARPTPAPRTYGPSVLTRLTKEDVDKLSESKKKELRYINDLLAKGKISSTQYNAEIANILKDE